MSAQPERANSPGINARVGLEAADIEVLAALRAFAPLATPIVCDDRLDLFKRLDDGEVEFAFIIAGNHGSGTVIDSFSSLANQDVAIVAEYIAEPNRNRHVLLGQGHWRRDGLRFRDGVQAGPVWLDFPVLGRGRTSILFALPDHPGALVRALGAISRRHLNLSNVEMRPSSEVQEQCTVVAEIDGYAHDAPVRAALDELGRLAKDVRVLGAYPTAGAA